jgi:hypothetical protein
MKKFILSCIMIGLISTSAIAIAKTISENGFYIGTQLGYAKGIDGNGYKDFLNIDSKISTMTVNRKVGGRLYVGYSFMPYVSSEIGYLMFPKNTYTSSGMTINTRHKTVDILFKGILPLKDLSPDLKGWDLFAKGGIAMTTNQEYSKNGKVYKIMPAFGVGIDYNFNNNFAMNISTLTVLSPKDNKESVYNYFTGNGNIKSYGGYLVAIGMTYKFLN